MRRPTNRTIALWFLLMSVTCLAAQPGVVAVVCLLLSSHLFAAEDLKEKS